MTAPNHGDDDRRVRLEEIAFGPSSSPAEAARARIALADLAAGRRVRSTGLEARVGSATAAAGGETGASRDVAAPGTDGAGTAGGPAIVSNAPGAVEPARASTAGAVGAAGGAAPAGAAGPTRLGASEPDAAPAAVVASSGPDATAGAVTGVGRDHVPEAVRDDGGDQGLQADPRDHRTAVSRAVGRWWTTRRAWLVGGAVVAVLGVFAAGIAVGTVRPLDRPADAPSPTDGAITLAQLLDAPQTFADQLPDSVDVPVVRSSTRLVFTNRSLAGDDAATPWNVWAGIGRDRSQICLVASADRIQATAGCYPKEAVLAGQVSLTAQSSSGVLDVRLVGGVVRGSVSSTS